VLSAEGLELRAGSRVLLADVSLRIAPGDKVGLVGRNGAGKTTLTRVLAGEAQPIAGTVTASAPVGYLPQDPRTGDLTTTARGRILGARGLDRSVAALRAAEAAMAGPDGPAKERALASYGRLESEFLAAGGYSAQAQADALAAGLGLTGSVLDQPLGTLSGGQRRRIELARILFSDASTLLLDEPTNHLDADSIVWLRQFLATRTGGVLVISHDVALLEATVNRVFHLDATRAALDIYNMGWRAYGKQRDADERRRRRERESAERTADALRGQAERMRAKATKARAAQSMLKRADRLTSGLEEVRRADRVAALRFPAPAPCGRTPLTAQGLSKRYGSQEIFAGVDLAIDRGSRVVVLGLNGAGKTTLLRLLSGVEAPDAGEVGQGHGLRIGYYAQEHETLDAERTVLENLRSAAPDLDDTAVRSVLGSFLFSGEDVDKPVRVLSGGEKTRLALATLVVSAANVLLLDEPTNNLDPASRHEILGALSSYEGAVVLVTHDEGAVTALDPERVLLLPDGVEDLWNDDYADLVALA
jgi:ATPase subunit of ABC transporter with duplicated ATPase domains